jgi:hypothetical protein
MGGSLWCRRERGSPLARSLSHRMVKPGRFPLTWLVSISNASTMNVSQGTIPTLPAACVVGRSGVLCMTVRNYGCSWVTSGRQYPGHTASSLHSRKNVSALGRSPSRPQILRLPGPSALQMACVAHQPSVHRCQNPPLLVTNRSRRAYRFHW